MENICNHIKMGLVVDQNKYTKLVNKITFKNVTLYNANSAATYLKWINTSFIN